MQGAVELVIVVVDDDSNIDDVIDIISVQVTNPSPTEGSNPTLGDINYYIGMAGFSYIELSYVVNCSKDFYGSDCDMFCVPRNNTFGHFTCNETSGSIICNEGYSNTSVWCTQCVPADTCCEYIIVAIKMAVTIIVILLQQLSNYLVFTLRLFLELLLQEYCLLTIGI